MAECRNFLFTNEGVTKLSSGINAGVTSISVSDGSVLPDPETNQIATIVLRDDDAGKYEIMNITARSGNTLIVERGAEGTTAAAWAANTPVVNSVTAAFFDRVRDGEGEVPPPDPDYGDVVLLLQIDAFGNMADNSLVAQSVDVIGTGVIDTEQTLFGRPTFNNPGSVTQLQNYVEATGPAGTYQFAGEFTLEGWFYIDSQKNNFNDFFTNDIQFPNAQYYQIYYTAIALGINTSSSPAGPAFSYNVAPPYGEWFHYAITRDASHMTRIFINGVSQGTPDGPRLGALGGPDVTLVRIGAGNSTEGDNGDSDFHFGEIRMTKKCRYTADFDPPTGPFGVGE